MVICIEQRELTKGLSLTPGWQAHLQNPGGMGNGHFSGFQQVQAIDGFTVSEQGGALVEVTILE